MRDPRAGTEVTTPPGEWSRRFTGGAWVRRAPAALDGGIGLAVSASRPPAPSALVEGADGTWLVRCTARRAVVLHLPAGF